MSRRGAYFRPQRITERERQRLQDEADLESEHAEKLDAIWERAEQELKRIRGEEEQARAKTLPGAPTTGGGARAALKLGETRQVTGSQGDLYVVSNVDGRLRCTCKGFAFWKPSRRRPERGCTHVDDFAAEDTSC